MDETEVEKILDQVARLLSEHYIFPDVAGRLGGLLAGQRAAGRYAPVEAPADLAALVTEDLQSVNGDLHLRLLYSEDEVPDEKDDGAEAAVLTALAAITCAGVARAERLDGNIGYLDLRPILFPPAIGGDAVVAAMNLLARTDALILDLRRCLGGDPDMVALLCTYLLGPEPVHLNDLEEHGRTRQFWTLPYVPGPRFGPDKPVYALTSAATFSGGEEVSYNLQQLRRGTLVGERTRGGAHPREGFRVHPHLLATIPVARAVNPVSGTNWEGTGVVPDIEVAADDAYRTAYASALEHVLRLPDVHRDVAGEARAALAGC